MRELYPRIVQSEHAVEGLAEELDDQKRRQQQYQAQVIARIALLPEAGECLRERGVVPSF